MRKGNKTWLAGMALVLALGAWHFNDVRSAVMESGHSWLLERYLLLLAVTLGAAGTIGLFLVGGADRRGRRLERIYPLAGISFGLLYMAVLPPLSAPDEISHYISAYQLSSHMLGQPSNSEDGYVLVRLEDWFLEDVHGDYIYEEKDGYRVKQGTKDGSGLATILGQTLTEETYEVIHQIGLRRQNETGRELAQSPHPPVVTTPLAYVPQALGLCLARIFNGNSLCLVYLGRLANLLFFVGVTWLAMRRMPFGKEVLFAVALLPMTLHLSASFSYDVWIMAGLFYLTAYCLYLTYEAEKVRTADVAVLAAVMAAVGPCKMVYMVFAGLCLMIPLHKFGSRRRWFLSACGVLGAMVIAMALANSWRVASYVAADAETSMGWAEESGYSLGMLFHQPLKCMQMVFNTVAWQSEHYHLTMIGAYLGNLDPVLNITYPVVMVFSFCLLCVVLRKPQEPLELSGGRKLWIWTLCLGCVGAVMLSMLLALTPLSAQVISGVQGRYFLPFLPILLMTVKNDRLVLTWDGTNGCLYVMCCANAYTLLRIYSIVSMRL